MSLKKRCRRKKKSFNSYRSFRSLFQFIFFPTSISFVRKAKLDICFRATKGKRKANVVVFGAFSLPAITTSQRRERSTSDLYRLFFQNFCGVDNSTTNGLYFTVIHHIKTIVIYSEKFIQTGLRP